MDPQQVIYFSDIQGTGYNIGYSNPVSHANLKNRPFGYHFRENISPTTVLRLKCPTTFLYPTPFPLNNSSTSHTYLPAFPTLYSISQFNTPFQCHTQLWHQNDQMYNKKQGGSKKESTTAKPDRDRGEISFVLDRWSGGAIGKNRKSTNFVREGVEKVEFKSRKCRILTFP